MDPNERDEQAWRGVEATLARFSPWVGNGAGFETSAGSALLADDARCGGFTLSDLVGMQFVVSVDLLAHARFLIRDTQATSVSAPTTLLRTAIETAATALWTIESESSDDRVARTLQLHHADQVNAATHKFDRGDEMDNARVGLREFFRGVAVIAGVDAGAVIRKLTTTDVLRDLEQSGHEALLSTWRMASGFAHGRPWAHLIFSDRTDTGVELANGSQLWRWDPNPAIEGLLAVTAANLITDLAERWEHLAA